MNHLYFGKAILWSFLIRLLCIVTLLLLLSTSSLFGQCRKLDIFKNYTENFEANNGSWTAGGVSSSWVWGKPGKTSITNAGSGDNCWITGGLTGSNYNSNERSWLQLNGCFDFSSIEFPYVEFKIFWDTRNNTDGVTFQYSTDNGTSWKNVGKTGDEKNCWNKNWFNNSSISSLDGLATDKEGWSGNTKTTNGTCEGGNGSGKWVTARHDLYELAWQKNILFRFTFGSGSNCTNYDGFAIDDFSISYHAPKPEISYFHTVPPDCNGKASGSAVASVPEYMGVPPYNYTWSNGSKSYTGSSITNIKSGIYKVTVTDGNNCISDSNFLIAEPSPLSHSINIVDADCGLANGKATIHENGGTPKAGPGLPYTYKWFTPELITDSIGSNLKAGEYMVVVRDDHSCGDTVRFSVNSKTLVTVTTTDVTCFGGNNGTATATFSGAPPYTFVWSPSGGTAQTATKLTAGGHSVTVTDKNGCSGTETFTIHEPKAIKTKLDSQNTTCGQSNGSASVTVDGGSGTYSYLWMPGNFTTASIDQLVAGTYNVTVTDAATGCNTTEAVVIKPSLPLITQITYEPTTCGKNNGSAAVTTSGGSGNYTYLWQPGNFATAAVDHLAPGTYTLTVIDATKGCSKTAQVIISPSTPLAIQVNSTPTSCGNNNGSANVIVNGGSGNYTYIWTPGNFTTASINNLSSGIYNVSVTDATTGCSKTDEVVISSSQALTTKITSAETSCGNSNGNANVTVNGGSGNYTYLWSPGNFTTPTINNLAAGTYHITVTDATTSCTKTDEIIINPSTALTTQISSTPTSCGKNNGSATVTVSNGSGNYIYLWTPANYNTSKVDNLSAGTYQIVVTDVTTGCEKTGEIIIAGSTVFNVEASGTQPTCGLSNGSVSAQVSGGKGSYTYLWSPGNYNTATVDNLGEGTYTISVTDVTTGCVAIDQVILNPSSAPKITGFSTQEVLCYRQETGSISPKVINGTAPYSYKWNSATDTYSTADLHHVGAGKYVLSLTDAIGCEAVDSIIINQPAVLSHSTKIVDVLCGKKDGSAVISEIGGTAPYTFNWAPTGGTSATAAGLDSGLYVVTVIDKNQCIDTVQIQIQNLGGLSVAVESKKDVSCFEGNNGSVVVKVTGTAAPFTYVWTDALSSSATADNLKAGKYSVTVTDKWGCTTSTEAVISQPNPLQTIVTSENASCGNNNGKAKVVARNGTAPYSYVWSTGNNTTNEISNLSSGHYTVTVIDNSGCSKIDSAVITSSPKPVVKIASTNVLCNGKNNGTAKAEVTGNGSYSFLWTYGYQVFNTESIDNLKPGKYNLTVTDASGCSAEDSVTITEPAAMQVSVTAKATMCGLDNGSAKATVAGGEAPYRYAWSSGSNISTPNNLSAGAHRLLVFDAKNCSAESQPVFITSSAKAYVSLGKDTSICPGNELILNPGNFRAYSWQDNSNTPTYKVNRTGQYSVLVTDTLGCTATAFIKVDVNCQDILFPTAFTPNGDGHNDGFCPLGTLSSISNYTLRVYNRWGQAVFSANNPYQKWDGKQNGNDPGTGTFIWIAEYSFNGQPKKIAKGTVLLIK